MLKTFQTATSKFDCIFGSLTGFRFQNFCRNMNFIGNESPILELELRSWSWLSSGAILPFLLSVEWSSRDIKHLPRHYIMSSLNIHLYTQLLRLYDQKTEKGQFFVQISTLLYAFKLSHTCEFSSKVLDILNILDIRY